MIAWFRSLPWPLAALVYLLILLLVIIFLAWILHGAGGADWHVKIGHFHWNVGVT